MVPPSPRALLVVAALTLGCSPVPPAAAPAPRPDAGAPPPGPGATARLADGGEHDVALQQLKPGVWVHTSWQRLPDGAWFPSNGLVVRDGDQLIMVDTAWGEQETARLLARIARTIGLPVSGVIATHFHDDRVGGARELASRGIALLATPDTQRRAAEVLPSQARTAFRGELPLRAVGDVTRVGLLEIFYPGPGHAPDNVVVWLERDRLLFGGCAVKSAASRSLGNVADADLGAWPSAIDRVRDRYGSAEIVVPGHGAVGDMGLLAHTRELLGREARSP
jgi:metallo-beta-lactamase class B VIM